MKKLVVFCLVAFCAISAKAQMYRENQAQIEKELSYLESDLDKVNDRIYYLDVTLDQQIAEALNTSNKKYLLQSSNLKKLQKEKYFAPKELAKLKVSKENLEKTLETLRTTYFESIKYRTQSDMKSNLPEKMGHLEYKKRTRAQMFKASEDIVNGESSLRMYPGLLINYKIGRNELATFTITRVGFSEFPTITKTLDPEERLEILLSIGTYKVDVVCGAYRGSVICRVDPRVIKRINKQDVYWFAAKTMSDF